MAKRINTPVDIQVQTGTAPMTIVSTTMVSNLNAEMVGGYRASDLLGSGGGGTGPGNVDGGSAGTVYDISGLVLDGGGATL